MPTPAKPLNPATLNWKIDSASVSPRPAGYPSGSGFKKREDGTIVMDDYATSDEAAVAAFHEYYKGYDVLTFFQPYDWAVTNGRGNPWPTKITDPTLLEFYRNQEKTFRERGIVALRYGGWGVWTNGPEWDPWGQEMLMAPKTPTIWEGSMQTFQSPFVEWYVGSWAQNARNTGVRGVRFDTQFPWLDSASPYYGEAWVSDIDGKTRGHFSLFRARELTKRLYRIFNGGEVEGGIIYHPAGGPPMMLLESFVTLRETGEGPYMHGKSLKEAYPQDMMRVIISGKPYGLVELHNTKGAPLQIQNRIGACLAAGIRPRMFKRPGGSDPRSYTPHLSPTSAIYDAWDWIDRATSQWHPHWQNKELVTTSSDAGEHYVSFNLQPGKRILVVATNYEQKDATVSVKLDLAKLGFATGATLLGEDAITGEPVEVKNGEITLPCGPELYRYVKIALGQ